MMNRNADYLDLQDYRRKVHEIYAAVRQMSDSPERAHREFIRAREEQLANHPQSPLSADQKTDFTRLSYYKYEPDWRCQAELEFEVEPAELKVDLEQDGPVRMRRIARAHFRAAGSELQLSLFWMQGYGGGLFLPFRDNTNKGVTYGGGRYLLDSVKGADLGTKEGRLVLDFNYAFNPSCAYNPRWHCPLAPPENWLNHSIPAGERRYQGAE